ncbi:MAG TPA: hypothetical protein VMT03_18580 [Polyangia bacterium]|nr:hypothetical protein [Polyangia bacterium]
MNSPRRSLLLISAVLTAAACSSGPGARGSSSDGGGIGAAVPCSVTAPTSCPSPGPSFADVQPIIQQNCAGPCHSGIPGGPWPLTSYEHVADWADVIRSDLVACNMPPADGGVSLDDADRLAILTWIRCGYPE